MHIEELDGVNDFKDLIIQEATEALEPDLKAMHSDAIAAIATETSLNPAKLSLVIQLLRDEDKLGEIRSALHRATRELQQAKIRTATPAIDTDVMLGEISKNRNQLRDYFLAENEQLQARIVELEKPWWKKLRERFPK